MDYVDVLFSFHPYTVKKPCQNAPKSGVDNGGGEQKDVGVGIFRSPRRSVSATVVHVGISRGFFLQCRRFWGGGTDHFQIF